ncbi:MAG: DUF5667 domain-containing protein [Candidatus Paceibacterota bacterium]
MKKRSIFGIIVAFLTFIVFLTSIPIYAQDEVKIESKDVQYELPYPGILPDNPLYFLKSMRDRLWIFFTRDNNKKAELLLHISDKKTRMAILLSQKGKWDLATDTTQEAEEQFLELVESLERARNQGASSPGEFILEVKLSNEKHAEVTEDLLTNVPQGDRLRVEGIMKLNKKVKQELDRL